MKIDNAYTVTLELDTKDAREQLAELAAEVDKQRHQLSALADGFAVLMGSRIAEQLQRVAHPVYTIRFDPPACGAQGAQALTKALADESVCCACCDGLRLALDEASDDLRRCASDYHRARAERDEAQAQLKLVRENVNTLAEQAKTLEDELDKARQEVRELQGSPNAAKNLAWYYGRNGQQLLDVIQRECNEFRARLPEVERELRRMTEFRDEALQYAQRANAERDEAKKALGVLNTRCQELANRANDLTTDRDKWRKAALASSHEETLRANLAEHCGRPVPGPLADLQAANATLNRQLEETVAKLAEAQEQAASARKHLGQRDAELGRTRAHLKNAQDAAASARRSANNNSSYAEKAALRFHGATQERDEARAQAEQRKAALMEAGEMLDKLRAEVHSITEIANRELQGKVRAERRITSAVQFCSNFAGGLIYHAAALDDTDGPLTWGIAQLKALVATLQAKD